jgi:hypothetical protein
MNHYLTIITLYPCFQLRLPTNLVPCDFQTKISYRSPMYPVRLRTFYMYRLSLRLYFVTLIWKEHVTKYLVM